jgi:hypothetical protein
LCGRDGMVDVPDCDSVVLCSSPRNPAR